MQEIVKQILTDAVYAPSGDNSQPWKFKIGDNFFDIFNIPDKDLSPYNFLQRGSLVAHGALLENVFIISSHLGYKANVLLFPENKNPSLIARVILEKTEPLYEPLYEFIRLRATNRKPYNKTRSIKSFEREEILSVSEKNSKEKVFLVEGGEKKDLLAKYLAINDRLLLENKSIHDAIFEQISWTVEEERKRRGGLYVKTLELVSPQEFLFKLFRNWLLVKLLNKVGLSRFIAKEGEKLYKSSSAIGCIVIPDEDPKNFILTGRLLQKVWLKVTQLGLSLQPLAGLIYLVQRVKKGENENLENYQVELVKKAYDGLKDVFSVKSGIISMVFRLGEGGEPSAHSSRRPPEIIKS